MTKMLIICRKYFMCENTCLSDSADITCEIPGEVTHGKNSWESQNYPKYGEIIHYVCNDGYTLTGKDTIMCSEDGEYDSQPPECKGKPTEAMCLT